MTDDKGAGEVKYIHRLTWDLEGCFPECPKCAYDKGRKSMEKDFQELLELVNGLHEHCVDTVPWNAFNAWKQARGIE